MKTSSLETPAFRSKNLIGVLSFLKHYWVGATLAIGLLFFNIGLEMTLPQISGQAINHFRNALHTGAAFNPWIPAGQFIGLAVLRSVIGFILGRLRNRVVQGTLRDLRAAYFDAVQRLSFAYHDKTNTGELISRGVGDIARNISGVASAAKDTTRGANDMRTASQELSQMASRLQQAVSKFTF